MVAGFRRPTILPPGYMASSHHLRSVFGVVLLTWRRDHFFLICRAGASFFMQFADRHSVLSDIFNICK